MADGCWICSKCTWVNKTTESSCNACGKSAPPGTTVAAAPPPVAPYYPTPSAPPTVSPYYQVQYQSQGVPDDLWVCSTCSWVNKTTEGSCKACGRNALPGTVLAPPPTAVVAPLRPPPVQPAAYYHPVQPIAYHPPPTAPTKPVPPPTKPVPPPPPPAKPVVAVQQQDDFVSGFGQHRPTSNYRPTR